MTNNRIQPLEVTRYPHKSFYPTINRLDSEKKTMRVTIVYALLYRFRIPIFRRLSDLPILDVEIFAGEGKPGTKMENAQDTDGLRTKILWTLQKNVNSTGRSVTLTVNPTLMFELFKSRPDVLLIQGGMVPNNLISLVYAKLTNTPIVWWSLGRVRGRQFTGLSRYYQKLNQWIEKCADSYAGYSSASVDYFLSQGYKPEACFNLVNVVDTELVSSRIEAAKIQAEQLRERLGLQAKRIILFVGSLTQTKGIHILVEAFARLEELHDDTRVVIVGDGPERKRAEKLTTELRMNNYILFTGTVYDGVEAYFQLGDLFILPGTGGLAVSEGMTHGLPVICSVGDGVEVDLIEEGVNGFLIEPDSPEQLADRIREILVEPGKLQQMGDASRRIIDERANIRSYIDEMLSAINYAVEVKKRENKS